MKFIGGFTWKYINAKHVVIQVEDPKDYATLLVGQNGMPVWYVDRHLMRVRWSPDFNPYFETPIAAVWCNLVGLPIHLFEKSALFAIGGMLETPIQIDHATATQSRLSFARICVEIDISKPPTEEYTIDMMGREVTQKVVWGKIPLYCRECCHVGHSSSTCYANGKREKPVKQNYHRPSYGNPQGNQPQPYRNPMAGNTERGRMATQQMGEMETNGIPQHQEMEQSGRRTGNNVTQQEQGRTNQGAKNLENVDDEGFRKQGRRRGNKHNKNNSYNRELPRTNSTGDIRQAKGMGEPKGNEAVILQISAITYHKHGCGTEAHSGRLDEAMKSFVKPSYYKQLENGDFEMDDIGEGCDSEEEENTHTHEVGDCSKPPEGRLIMQPTAASDNVWQIEEGG